MKMAARNNNAFIIETEDFQSIGDDRLLQQSSRSRKQSATMGETKLGMGK
jgi:hypothetical protein